MPLLPLTPAHVNIGLVDVHDDGVRRLPFRDVVGLLLHLDELLVGEGAAVVLQREDALGLAMSARDGLLHLATLVADEHLMGAFGAAEAGQTEVGDHIATHWGCINQEEGSGSLWKWS